MFCQASGQTGMSWRGFGTVRTSLTATCLFNPLSGYFLAHRIAKKDERILVDRYGLSM
jgi:hypothetical protein